MQGLAEKFITAGGQVAIPPGTATGSGSASLVGVVQCNLDATSVFDTNTFANTMRPIAGNNFVYAGGASFVLTPAACILTYALAEPVKTFLFLLTTSFEATTPPNNGTCGAAISVNGDFIGGPMFGVPALVAAGRSTGEMIANGAGGITSFRRAQLNPGDTVQPIGSMFAGNTSLNLSSLTLAILEVSTP